MSDVLIVGGGPAGAVAAAHLAAAGRGVTLFERNAHPVDKVCGDFLSAEAVAALDALGVDLSAAAEIRSLRLIHGDCVATTRLPFVGLGLSRRTLDEALLRVAAECGTKVVRGHAVRSVQRDRGQWTVDCGAFDRVTTTKLLLATGKHNLRGAARQERGIGLVGFKTYYTLADAQRDSLRGHVELVLLRGGYAGLQQVEGDKVVLCAVLPAARLRTGDRWWSGLLDELMSESRHLRERLGGAGALLERPYTIADLPYGYRHSPDQDDPAGLFRLGDQAAVIASLTGDGIALALASGTLAARAVYSGRDARSYHQHLADGMARQMRVASIVHRLAVTPQTQAWVQRICRRWPGVMRLATSLTRTRLL
ncbi:MAG TPA: FAD-dependent monooxygenase [Acetobacteraceae bacterium]|nr:FAD-dependent monooxygenase [Acetobacteraceae bacterium]